MSRTGHSMSTKYNVLFNGQTAFDEAKLALDNSYEDNFWERLPIEPLEIEETFIPLPGQSTAQSTDKQGFDKAEEKAVKSIQKHSMVIDGLEKNKQIDEAQDTICQALILGGILGVLGTYFLLGHSDFALRSVLPANSPALKYARPYLKIRALAFIPSLFSTVGFSAFRGCMDTVTPLKIR